MNHEIKIEFPSEATYQFENNLRKVVPYQYAYTSNAKGRWLGRKLFEVMKTEFLDKSASYYVRSSNPTPACYATI
jgi:hypothetical protein